MSWNAVYRTHLAQIPYPDMLATARDGRAFGVMLWGINDISFSSSFASKRQGGQLGIWLRVSIFDITNRLIVGNELVSKIARSPALADDGAYKDLSSPIPYVFVAHVPPEHGLLLQLCAIVYTGETRVVESHPSSFVAELASNVVVQDEIVLGWTLFRYEDRGIRKVESVLAEADNAVVSELQMIRGNPAELFNDEHDVLSILSRKAKGSRKAPFLRYILFKYRQRDLAIPDTPRYVLPFFSLIDAVHCPPIFAPRGKIKLHDQFDCIEVPGTLLDAPERTELVHLSVDAVAASVARFYDFNSCEGPRSTHAPTAGACMGALRMVEMHAFEQHIKECIAQLLAPKLADRAGHEIDESSIRIHIMGYSVKILPHDGFQPLAGAPCEVPLVWIAEGERASVSRRHSKKVGAPSDTSRALMDSQKDALYDISSKQVSPEAMTQTDLKYDMSSAPHIDGKSRKRQSHKKGSHQLLTVQMHAGLIVALCVTISIGLNTMGHKDIFLPRCEFCLGWGAIDVLPTLFIPRARSIPYTVQLKPEDEFTVGVPGINLPILNCNRVTKVDIWAKNDDGAGRSRQAKSRAHSRSTSNDTHTRDRAWPKVRSSSHSRAEAKARPAQRSASRYSTASSASESYTDVSSSSDTDSDARSIQTMSGSTNTLDCFYEYICPVISLSFSPAENAISPTNHRSPKTHLDAQPKGRSSGSSHPEQSEDSLRPSVVLNSPQQVSRIDTGSDSDYVTQTPTVKQRKAHIQSNDSAESVAKLSSAPNMTSPPDESLDDGPDEISDQADTRPIDRNSRVVEPSSSSECIEKARRPEYSTRSSTPCSKDSNVPQRLPPIGSEPQGRRPEPPARRQDKCADGEPQVTANLEQTLTQIRAYDPQTYRKYKNYAETRVLAISPLQTRLNGIGFIHILYHGSGGDVQEVHGENINLSDLSGPKSISPYNLSTPAPMSSQLIGCTVSLFVMTHDDALDPDQLKARAYAVASCYISFQRTRGGSKMAKRAYYDLYGHTIINEQEFSDHIVPYKENLSFQADLRSVHADSFFDLAREPEFTIELTVKLKTLEEAHSPVVNDIPNLRWEAYKSLGDTAMATAELRRPESKPISVDGHPLDLLGTQRDMAPVRRAFPDKKRVTKSELMTILDDYLAHVERENNTFYTAERLTQMSMRASHILQQYVTIYPHYTGSVCLFPGLESYERHYHTNDCLAVSLISPMPSQLARLGLQLDYRADDLYFLQTEASAAQINIKNRPHWIRISEYEIQLHLADPHRTDQIFSPYAVISSSNPEVFARSTQIQLVFLLEYIKKGTKRTGTPLTSVVNVTCHPYMPLTTNLRVCLPHTVPKELQSTVFSVVFGINTLTREVFLVSPDCNGCYTSQEELEYLHAISGSTGSDRCKPGESAIHDDDATSLNDSHLPHDSRPLECRILRMDPLDNQFHGLQEDITGPSVQTPKPRLAILPGANRTFCSLPHIIKAGLGRAGVIYLVCNLTKELLPVYFNEGNNYHVVEIWKDQSTVLKFGVTWSIYKYTYSEMNAGVSIQAPTQLISTETSLINAIPNVYNGSFSIPGPGVYVLSLFPAVGVTNTNSLAHKGIVCLIKVKEIPEIAHRYKITIKGVENKRFQYSNQASRSPNVQMERPSITKLLGVTSGTESEPGSGIVKFRCGRWIWHRPYETTVRVLVYSAEDTRAPYVVLFYLRFE